MDNLTLKKDLSEKQLSMVTQEVERRSKSKLVMYLLWFFTGTLGGHRYYLGDMRAIFMTLTLGGFGFWALIDVFFIGKRLENKTVVLEKEVIDKVKSYSNENADNVANA